MASLSPVASADAFVTALEKSALLDAATLAKARAAAASAADPRSLARELIKAGTLTRWQAGQLLHGYYLLVVGKYKLLDQLSSGETGRVYLAEHAQMERRAALKILSRRHTAKPEVLQRFLAEAQLVCALDHRNLSHIYDVNQDGDKYYLVMEHVEGEDLQKAVQTGGPLAAAEAAQYALQAVEGLVHAHEKQVFHGDLKPSNLVVDHSGVVKITDIGQARLVEAPASATGVEETSEAASLAAAVYRAPEVRDGKQPVDPRSDIYSLGNVLCFLLAGKPAFDAADAQARLGKADADLASLCQQMLAENPAERPQSMAQVHAALAAAISAASAAAAAMPAQAAGEKPAAKVKKPPVAKRIEADAPEPAVAIATPTQAAAADNPLGGFVLKTKGRSGATKAISKSSGGATAGDATAVVGKRSYLPWIIGGAIGGGVLLLGGIVLAVVVVLGWGAGEADRLVASAKLAADKAAAETVAPAAKSDAEGNPESNPESNPVVPQSEPAAVDKPAEPAPMPQPVKPVEPMAVEPAAVPVQPEATAPQPVEPQPVEPKPAEPAPPPAQPVEPAPQPVEPMPAPAAPANPFQGFAGSVTLPKLPLGTAEPTPQTLAPLVLGPCVVDEKALVILQLKGGGTAIRGGKQRFELKEAEGGISLRDWDIVLSGGGQPLVAAKLSAKNGELSFAWTPDGARDPSAPLLSNCGLTLTAGTGRHDLALRPPVIAKPLTVELEKGASVKWQIEQLPDPKSVFVEVSRLEGNFPKHKFDKPQMELSDTNAIWTGDNEDALILGIKLTSTASARGIEIRTSPQVKFEIGAKPQPLIKKTLSIEEKQVKQAQAVLTTQLQTLPAQPNERVEQQKNLLNAELEKVNGRSGQLTQLAALIGNLQGKGRVHFRVYHQTEDGQIDLLVTDDAPAADNPPAAEKEEAKEDAAAKADR